MKKCVKCQLEIDDDDLFCNECGARQNEAVMDPEKTSFVSKDEDINPIAHVIKKEIKTDCKHFKLEINEGSTIFLANTMSRLQFRITSISDETRRAEKFILYLKYPGNDDWHKESLRINKLSSERIININYRPENEVSGNCSVDLHFSYLIDKKLYCFEQQIVLHIHDNFDMAEKLKQGGMNINIGNLTQEGKAGDPTLNLFNGLYENSKTSYEKFSELKRDTIWTELELFQAVPLENESSEIKKMFIPLAPFGKDGRLVIYAGNNKILLYSGEITAGRSRDADYLLRNEPPKGQEWSIERLQEMNLYIDRVHCSFGILDNKAFIKDCDSLNGTFINSKQLQKGAVDELSYHINHDISLASPDVFPRNIELSVKVYPSGYKIFEPDDKDIVPAGLVIKQRGKDDVSAVIVSRWIPMSALIPEGENLFVIFRENHFAVTDGKEWNWLIPGQTFQFNRISIKVEKN